jgi:preprotein translocase subunit YajC
MSFFITNALADTATTTGTAAAPNNMASLLMLVGFVVIFYFLLWRPQAKRAKDQRNLINNLARGDEIITSGGLVGKIMQLNDDFVTLQVASNVEVKLQRSAVTQVLPKGTLKSAE